MRWTNIGWDQGRLVEDPLEQCQHPRQGPEPVQRFVRPNAAKHLHVLIFRILAGGSGIGDRVLNRMVWVEPAAGSRLLQEAATHLQDRFAWQQAPEEQVAVALKPLGKRRSVFHEIGRIEKIPHRVHPGSATSTGEGAAVRPAASRRVRDSVCVAPGVAAGYQLQTDAVA